MELSTVGITQQLQRIIRMGMTGMSSMIIKSINLVRVIIRGVLLATMRIYYSIRNEEGTVIKLKTTIISKTSFTRSRY